MYIYIRVSALRLVRLPLICSPFIWPRYTYGNDSFYRVSKTFSGRDFWRPTCHAMLMMHFATVSRRLQSRRRSSTVQIVYQRKLEDYSKDNFTVAVSF